MIQHEEFYFYVRNPVSFESLHCYQLLEKLGYEALPWLSSAVTEAFRAATCFQKSAPSYTHSAQELGVLELKRSTQKLLSENSGLIDDREEKAFLYALSELFFIIKSIMDEALPSVNPERLQAISYIHPSTVIVSYFTVNKEHATWHLPRHVTKPD